MKRKIIFSLMIALALFTASITLTTITTTNIFAQNASNKANQTKSGAGANAMNKTNAAYDNTTGNLAQGAAGGANAMNKTNHSTSSISGTHGAGAALQNQTSKGLSDAAGSIMQGIKNLLGGNRQK